METGQMDELKPFDWTFTTDYSGTLTGDFTVTPTDTRIDLDKLRQREKILFYHDLLLFEDELHDNGTAVCSVKIVSNTCFIGKYVQVRKGKQFGSKLTELHCALHGMMCLKLFCFRVASLGYFVSLICILFCAVHEPYSAVCCSDSTVDLVYLLEYKTSPHTQCPPLFTVLSFQESAAPPLFLL
jgi:hypothetical protein